MDKLVDHLFVFEGNGKIRFFNGNYQDYLDEDLIPETVHPEISLPKHEIPKPLQTSQKRKLSYKEQLELNKLTKEIPELEVEKGRLIQLLNQGSSDHEELLSWSKEMERVDADLDLKGMRWLELND